MNAGRALAQAKMFPESIVSRQELAAAATSTGPMTTMITPRMKMSDLNGCLAPAITWFSVTVRLLDSRLQGLASVDGCSRAVRAPVLGEPRCHLSARA